MTIRELILNKLDLDAKKQFKREFFEKMSDPDLVYAFWFWTFSNAYCQGLDDGKKNNLSEELK